MDNLNNTVYSVKSNIYRNFEKLLRKNSPKVITILYGINVLDIINTLYKILLYFKRKNFY